MKEVLVIIPAYNEEANIGRVAEDLIRNHPELDYVMDILEPHNPDFKDNLGKAKGFALYANEEPRIGRIQLIRMSKDAAGNNRFKRLDMAKGAIRTKVLAANSVPTTGLTTS